MKKICVVTGTRAEYGLLRRLLFLLRDDVDTQLQLMVTGMHLAPEFGDTVKEIEQDGFIIERRIDMLLAGAGNAAIGKSVGLGVIGFAQAFDELRPDIVVVLGDRFEILSAAVAAMLARIPIAHLHGGELTTGAMDDAIRHAITKMSHWHFAANETYRNRIIQLGEGPDRVYSVGGLGVDAIRQINLLDREALAQSLGFELQQRNLLITFHPATLDQESPEVQMKQLLSALEQFPEVGLIFTYPNADAGGRELIPVIDQFVTGRDNAHAFASLGQLRYLSCMQQCDGVVGNSSSGLLEAPAFCKGTVNIGTRQHGRLQASSVINCEALEGDIASAVRRLLSPEFVASLETVVNPYGDGGASTRIVDILRNLPLDGQLQKQFFDLPADYSKFVQ